MKNEVIHILLDGYYCGKTERNRYTYRQYTAYCGATWGGRDRGVRGTQVTYKVEERWFDGREPTCPTCLLLYMEDPSRVLVWSP